MLLWLITAFHWEFGAAKRVNCRQGYYQLLDAQSIIQVSRCGWESWTFNSSNYWCKKPCGGGRGLEEVCWLALSKPAFTEAKRSESWELRWDQCCRSYLDPNYSHFWSIGSSPHWQTWCAAFDQWPHTHSETHQKTTLLCFLGFCPLAYKHTRTHTPE